jgi:glycine/D-amino acid oxidase-like deaminating enzyme
MSLKVAIFGAGAFGGWTALQLARQGASVRLFDAWGPGNPRASSGGETRIIRATYGSHTVFTRMAARALDLWRRHEQQYGDGLLRTTGALWLFQRREPFAAASSAALRAVGLRLEEVDLREARRRYPQIDFSDLSCVLFEPDAGYLFASRACRHVVSCFVAEGGHYSQAAVQRVPPLDGLIRRVALTGGSWLEADAFVFACGAWLAPVFPDVIGPLVSATRQEVCYFGPPSGDTRFSDDQLPVWLDFGERFLYGIPGVADGGFKIADDTPGPLMDPTTDDRVAGAEALVAMRTFLKKRFPALANAPLIRSEVCQYESTPDSTFIIDRHPRAPNVWIVGGGSGHGFKMGPAIGERVAAHVLGQSEPDPAFGLARFASPPAGGWAAKWS